MKRILLVTLGLLLIGALGTLGLAATTADGQLDILVDSYGDIGISAGTALIHVTNPAAGTYVSAPDFGLTVTANVDWTISAEITGWEAGFNPFNADAVHFGPAGGPYVAQNGTCATGVLCNNQAVTVEAQLDLTRVTTGLPLSPVSAGANNHGHVTFTLHTS
ncbi:MAG: hypothetical protein ACM3X6_00320 [Patescibacteria group bacterium]